MRAGITTASGVELELHELDPDVEGALVHREFNRILAAGEGYPQAGPIDYEEFASLGGGPAPTKVTTAVAKALEGGDGRR